MIRRLLVCGSRDWTDGDLIDRVLTGYVEDGATTLIHGDSRGADRIARMIALRLGMEVIDCPADWRGKGHVDLSAGPRRNAFMLTLKPDIVVAFKDGFDESLRKGGTENMVKLASSAGLTTIICQHATGGQ